MGKKSVSKTAEEYPLRQVKREEIVIKDYSQPFLSESPHPAIPFLHLMSFIFTYSLRITDRLLKIAVLSYAAHYAAWLLSYS